MNKKFPENSERSWEEKMREMHQAYPYWNFFDIWRGDDSVKIRAMKQAGSWNQRYCEWAKARESTGVKADYSQKYNEQTGEGYITTCYEAARRVLSEVEYKDFIDLNRRFKAPLQIDEMRRLGNLTKKVVDELLKMGYGIKDIFT